MDSNERVYKLNAIRALGFTEEEKGKINRAFCLIDEVMFKCEQGNQKEKVMALWTAFGIDQIIKSIAKEGQ